MNERDCWKILTEDKKQNIRIMGKGCRPAVQLKEMN